MIACPPGWRAIRVDDGVRLLPLETPATAEIRYRFRHPIVPIEELIARKLAPTSTFVVESATSPESLVTDEGEYAALIIVSGRLDGKRVQRDIGMVYGDDYYALVLGVVVDETRFGELTELTRSLVLGDQQLLGTQRRRRFRCVAPAGWREQRWDFESTWSAPDDATVSLTTLPALPSQGASKKAVAQLVEDNLHRGFVVTRASGPEPMTTPHGLGGQRWRLEGHFDKVPSTRDIVVLQDDRYIYCVRLETRSAAETWRPRLDALVDSIEPIPRPRSTRPDLTGLHHWIE